MSDAPPASHQGRRAILAAMTVVAILAALGAGWRLTRPNARQIFLQGLATGYRDPAAGERLFRRAIEAAGGRYPDAQIALCDALARQNLWENALSAFATVDVQACRADLLLAFGRDALLANHQTAGRE